MNTILIYLSLGIVVLWTARFARAKGRNPWVWGGSPVVLAVALWLLDFKYWQLAAMAPMVCLLFLRSHGPQEPGQPRSEGVTCPKCQTRHLASQHYCVNCGWDLTKPSTTPAATGEAPAPAPVPVAEVKPATVASQASMEPVAVEAPPAPEPQPKPPRVHRPPTAAGMTERGLALFGQGKLQEAIDQFTKAIALDPGYLAAWQRRAEAYQRLGRPKEAAEDMRRLQTLGGQAQ
jgi:tetratricopeptide (TPR) repeat protein